SLRSARGLGASRLAALAAGVGGWPEKRSTTNRPAPSDQPPAPSKARREAPRAEQGEARSPQRRAKRVAKPPCGASATHEPDGHVHPALAIATHVRLDAVGREDVRGRQNFRRR